MNEDRIPERGPNGGTYPGWEGQQDLSTPPPKLPPRVRQGHTVRIILIVMGLVLLVCGGMGVAILEAASSPFGIDGLPGGVPVVQPLDPIAARDAAGIPKPRARGVDTGRIGTRYYEVACAQ